MKIYNFLVLLPLLFISCGTTSNYTVSDSANMAKYKYASIEDVMDYTGSPAFMDLDVKIYDLLNDAGVSAIGENEIDTLPQENKEELLLVKYSASEDNVEVIVSITFIDYITGRPISSCRGAQVNWFASSLTRKQAVDEALSQARQMFSERE